MGRKETVKSLVKRGYPKRDVEKAVYDKDLRKVEDALKWLKKHSQKIVCTFCEKN